MRDTGALVASHVFASACMLAVGVIVARELGPAGKGYFDLVVRASTLLGTLLGLSLPSGVFFHASRGRVDYRRLSWLSMSAAAMQGAIAAGVLLVLRDSPLTAWLLPPNPSWSAVASTALLLVILQAQQLLRGVVVGRGEYGFFAFTEALGRGGTLVAVSLLVAAGHATPASSLGALVASMGTSVVLLARRAIRVGAHGVVVPLTPILRYSLPLYAGHLVQFLNYRLDVFLLNGYMDLGAVGLYTVAVSLAQTLWLVPNALGTQVMRSVAEQGATAQSSADTARVNRRCLWFSAAAGVALFSLATVGLTGVFGREFRESLRPLGLLLPGIVAFCPTIILSAYLNGAQRQVYTTWVACGSVVVTVLLNVALIPAIGISGAALASTVSYTCSSIATIAIVRRMNPSLSVPRLVGLERADLRWALGCAWSLTGIWPGGRRA